MNIAPMSPTPPLTPLKELRRRSAQDATLLVTDSSDRVFVQKLIPAQVANLEVWQALARASHPALAKVWQVKQESWGLTILMDYVAGPTLEQLVEAQGALSPGLTASLVSQVAQGAEALHELGIVHRDLSCSNIVAGPSGACIIDAGIARLLGDGAKRHDTVLLGTQGFAAPEQYGFAQTSPRTDIYALGKLTGYLLTGISPTSPIFEEALDDPAVVSSPLRQLIDRACALSPADRPDSAAAFARELAQAVEQLDLEAPFPGSAQPASGPQASEHPTAGPSASNRPAIPAWREHLATVATVAGALFCTLMCLGLFMDPTDISVPVDIWKFQCVSVGLLMGLAPGLATRHYLLRLAPFSQLKHPFLTWAGLLVALFFLTVLAVSLAGMIFTIPNQ